MTVAPSVLALLMLACSEGGTVTDRSDIVLATTTSVRDAGLLEVLLADLPRQSGFDVRVIAVGSGQAMELGRRGEADILVLHDPAGEMQFVADGFGVDRAPLMHNEFVVAGPHEDPAGVRGLASAVQALSVIAASGALFVSRGDRSGTHVKEQGLWRTITTEPSTAWYRESGQGMSATLQVASQLRAYTLCDLGTLLSQRSRLDLEILVEGDPALNNPYHVILVNPGRFPWVNADGARALKEHLLAPETQRTISAYGRQQFGRSLFVAALNEEGQDGR